MKRYKEIIFYVILISGFIYVMYSILGYGKNFEPLTKLIIHSPQKSLWHDFKESISSNFGNPLGILLIQVIAIMLVAKIFGWICKKIAQPTVVGEIAAGIVLGPSLIGTHFPEFSATLFPAASMENLHLLSQIGLILFMFIVGMELDLKTLRNNVRDAAIISQTSIIFPFTLAMLLSLYLYQHFAPPGVRFISFSLFIGIAMSITAFPVLARIVQERGLHKSPIGTVVITCAAVDDITAWSILAVVIAIVKAGSFVSSLYVIILSIIYVFIMIKLVRPFLKRVGELHATRENLTKPVVAIFLITLMISAYATELIGIHALFGAFIAGAIMPTNKKFRNIFIEKVEDISLILLLPIFFVFTGLRTQIGLLNEPYLWKVTGFIILVAIVGKFLGSAIAAKFVGQNWRNSLIIGTLMNTRGLVELVVLNIGYDLGVLTPEIFAMLVIMALVTTLLTGPSLDIIDKIFKVKIDLAHHEIAQISKYRILIAFGNPENGRTLLRLANSFIRNQSENCAVTVMHLSPINELHHFNVDDYEKVSFEPAIDESINLSQKITTLFKVSNDIESDIAEFANKGNYDLLLVGIGQSIYEGSLLGKVLGFTARIVNTDRIFNKVIRKEKLFENSPFDERTRVILSKTEVPVGIFVDKELSKISTILIPVLDQGDTFLIKLAQKLITNSQAQVSILDFYGRIKNNPAMKELIRAIEQNAPNHINLITIKTIDKELLIQNDLMLISIESWRILIDTQSDWLNQTPSTLILKSA